MRKSIDFPPYTEAEVKEILDDGSLMCDLYGDGYSDTGIVFPAGSNIISLSQAETERFSQERTARSSGSGDQPNDEII